MGSGLERHMEHSKYPLASWGFTGKASQVPHRWTSWRRCLTLLNFKPYDFVSPIHFPAPSLPATQPWWLPQYSGWGEKEVDLLSICGHAAVEANDSLATLPLFSMEGIISQRSLLEWSCCTSGSGDMNKWFTFSLSSSLCLEHIYV